MRHSFASLLFAASALALPQNGGLDGLSDCAATAAIAAIASTGCGLTDTVCICSNAGFIATADAAVSASCGTADAEASKAWGTSFCADAGVNIASTTTTTPASISGEVADPTLISAAVTPTGNSTTTDAPTETTTWINGTCTKYPHCHDGPPHSNDTAPISAPTQPAEPCDGKPGSCPSPAPTSATGPQYTGAAIKLITGSGIFGAAIVAAVFAL